MATKVEPIPIAASPLTPYICVKGGAEAIEFYKKAFGAEEIFRMPQEDGRIGHAELRIGMAQLMICDEFPEMKMVSPLTLGGSPVTLHLYVKDVDDFTEKAKKAGLKETRKVENQFYGDRGGSFTDPYGHVWWISSHIEDLSPEEVKQRAAKAYKERSEDRPKS